MLHKPGKFIHFLLENPRINRKINYILLLYIYFITI
jgi:hypothetical protein